MKATEQKLLGMLASRFRSEQSGNGPAWAFIPQVRDAAGFEATRTADAIAMSLWPSRGLELHGYEIKCARSDWMRELKNPAKAETFIKLVDRWWIVTSDAKVALPEELPPEWGLLVVQGNKLVTKVAAGILPRIGDPPFNATGRSFLAALLRSAARTHAVTPSEVQEAVTAAIEIHRDHRERERTRLEADVRELYDRIDAFQTASGVMLGREDGQTWYGARPASEVGAALKLVLNGDADLERYETRLRTMLSTADRLVSDLRQSLGEPEDPAF